MESNFAGRSELKCILRKRIDAASLAGGGKLKPAKLKKRPGKGDDENEFRATVVIAKANAERQTVTGVVLQPEVTDGHGDIMSVDVIAAAAHKFLAGFNKKTKLGLQHQDFKTGRFELVESFLAPLDMVIGSTSVKAGSWIMTVKVLDSKIWQSIKDGKLTGFSIGGVAKVQQLKK